MCVKFHDEEKRLEIIGGASCLYEEIQKWYYVKKKDS
jgi:hypothetical protein